MKYISKNLKMKIINYKILEMNQINKLIKIIKSLKKEIF